MGLISEKKPQISLAFWFFALVTMRIDKYSERVEALDALFAPARRQATKR